MKIIYTYHGFKRYRGIWMTTELQCPECGMKFSNEKRLERHQNTHKKRESKGKKQKTNKTMPDFDKPDFSQVM